MYEIDTTSDKNVTFTYLIENAGESELQEFVDKVSVLDQNFSVSITRKYKERTSEQYFIFSSYVTSKNEVVIDYGEEYSDLNENQIIVSQSFIDTVGSGNIIYGTDCCYTTLLNQNYSIVGTGYENFSVSYPDASLYVYAPMNKFWEISEYFTGLKVSFDKDLSARNKALLDSFVNDCFSVQESQVFSSEKNVASLVEYIGILVFAVVLFVLSNASLIKYFVTAEYNEFYILRLLGITKMRAMLRTAVRLISCGVVGVALGSLVFLLLNISGSKLPLFLLINGIAFLTLFVLFSFTFVYFYFRKRLNGYENFL